MAFTTESFIPQWLAQKVFKEGAKTDDTNPNCIIEIGNTTVKSAFIHDDRASKRRYTLTDDKYSIVNIGDKVGDRITGVTTQDKILNILKIEYNEIKEYLNSKEIELHIIYPTWYSLIHAKELLKIAELSEFDNVKLHCHADIVAGLEPRVTLLVNVGGASTTISLLNNDKKTTKIKIIDHLTTFGGRSFTDVITNLLLKKCNKNPREFSVDTLLEIEKNAERLKILLDKEKSVEYNFVVDSCIFQGKITATEYLQEISFLIERIKTTISTAIFNRSFNLAKVQKLILTGGGNRNPHLRQAINSAVRKFAEFDFDPQMHAVNQMIVRVKNKISRTTIRSLDWCLSSIGPSSTSDDKLRHRDFSPILERRMFLPETINYFYSNIDPNENSFNFELFMGEHLNAKKNLSLLSDTIQFPKELKTLFDLEFRATLSTSGIFEIQASIEDKTVYSELVSLYNEYDDNLQEDKNILNEIDKIKWHPTEDTLNRAVIDKAEDLYALNHGEIRELIAYRLRFFHKILDSKNHDLIKSEREDFMDMLNDLDKIKTD